MRELVARYEGTTKVSRPVPKFKVKSEDGIRSSVAVLPQPFQEKRALELWSGFLYGQPIWSYSDDAKVANDFEALVEIWNLAVTYQHYDAEDASIDAMRDMIRHHSDSLFDPFTIVLQNCNHKDLPAKVLMDHVVFGNCVSDPGTWVNDYLAMEFDGEAIQPLEHELCQMFLAKVEGEKAGRAPPDLTARCRYHSHMEQGVPCYLDK